MNRTLLAAFALVVVVCAGILGVFHVRSSPELAGRAVMIENAETLSIVEDAWGVPIDPETIEQAGLFGRADGSFDVFYRTGLPKGRRGWLFSIRIKRQLDGRWYMTGAPILETEVKAHP